jgi:hypothetical protein
MIRKTALIFALAVIAANGFLVPPSVSPADVDVVNALPFENLAEANTKLLSLKCAGCPVATAEGWVKGVDSQLQLILSVVGHGDGDALIMNGVQIFPSNAIPTNPLVAPQISSRGKAFVHLGYELEINPVVRSSSDQLDLILIDFQVVELVDRFVNGLDSVKISLVRTPSGKLMIANAKVAPTMNPVINPAESGEKCRTLICRWREIAAAKLSKIKGLKGCGSKSGFRHGRPTQDGRPQHLHHGHQYHGHHVQYSTLRKAFSGIKSVALRVIIPVFIGMALGLSASLIGMLIGNLIVFVWRALYRKDHRAHYGKVEMEESMDVMKDTSEDARDQSPPPYDEVSQVDEKAADVSR